MNKHIISLAIALPTILLTITPGLANPSKKNPTLVDPSNLNPSQPIGLPNGAIDQPPPTLRWTPQNRERRCQWRRWCVPPDSSKPIRRIQNVPTGIGERKTIPASIPEQPR
jgi:hypothetical protein